MATRKYFHLEAMIDASIMHDVLLLIDGRSRIIRMGAAKTAGDQDDGSPRAVPTGREFMAMFVQRNSRFKVRDAIEAATELGLNKSMIYTATNVLVQEGALKRIGPAEYKISNKSKLAKSAAIVKGAPNVKTGRKPGAKAPRGQTVPDRIIALLRSKQNGSGEGVPLSEIRKAVAPASGISPALASLLKRKLITRPAPAHYRASA